MSNFAPLADGVSIGFYQTADRKMARIRLGSDVVDKTGWWFGDRVLIPRRSPPMILSRRPKDRTPTIQVSETSWGDSVWVNRPEWYYEAEDDTLTLVGLFSLHRVEVAPERPLRSAMLTALRELGKRAAT